MTEYRRKNVATSDSESDTKSQHVARKPFPFYERKRHLAEDFTLPHLRRLAKSDGPQKGLDRIGWAICKFMMEIADLQSRRLARAEMRNVAPPESPWIYRDLYQLDRCDRDRRIHVGIPIDSLPYFHSDGLTWFLSWKDALGARMGRGRMLGRKPHDAPEILMIAPDEAYQTIIAEIDRTDPEEAKKLWEI